MIPLRRIAPSPDPAPGHFSYLLPHSSSLPPRRGHDRLSGTSKGRQPDRQKEANVRSWNRVLMLGSIRELALYRAEVLRHSGFVVSTPRNRTEALAAIENGGFDAAILSYTLPSELVEELVELLRQKCPECPVVCISQEGKIDRRIAPDEVVLAEHGPTALLEALRKVMDRRIH
jgi:hypothetical protein